MKRTFPEQSIILLFPKNSNALQNGDFALGSCTDISKEFDSQPWNLVEKWVNHGTLSIAYNCFQSFVPDQSQVVEYELNHIVIISNVVSHIFRFSLCFHWWHKFIHHWNKSERIMHVNWYWYYTRDKVFNYLTCMHQPKRVMSLARVTITRQ